MCFAAFALQRNQIVLSGQRQLGQCLTRAHLGWLHVLEEGRIGSGVALRMGHLLRQRLHQLGFADLGCTRFKRIKK